MIPPTPLRVALLSDIHDRVDALKAALPHLCAQSDVLLVLGDFVSPFVLRLLVAGYPAPIHVVFGNNDGDRFRLGAVAATAPQVRVHGEVLTLELAGRRIFAQHYPEVALTADHAAFDLIAYGHDHRAARVQTAGAVRVNPGPLMGYDPARDVAVACSWASYECGSGAVTFYRLCEDGAEVWDPTEGAAPQAG
jgi:putative phosphoesterase